MEPEDLPVVRCVRFSRVISYSDVRVFFGVEQTFLLRLPVHHPEAYRVFYEAVSHFIQFRADLRGKAC